MKVRIYPKPLTRINENWNSYGAIDTAPFNGSFTHPLITSDANGHLKNGAQDFQESFYKKIGIDIVTETVYNYPYPAITEKTLRPIANKRMFLMVGAPQTLSFLHSQGFKTFSPFINEDYDAIDDPIHRMQFIFSEIHRLANLNLGEVQNALKEYENILNANFENLLNLERNDFSKVSKRLSSKFT